MSALRIGIVGARFAADLHATNYRPLRPSRAELTAVCSRTREEAERFARRHAIPRVFTDYHALVASPDVDVVDICATTDIHHEIAVVAARAGKHVIVEKPLTGAFCDATEPRAAMFATALGNADAVLDAVAKAGVTLCYGEDFVYAPPVAKLRRLLDASGGVILELRAEESHSGSHAAYARRWKSAGGGAFLRMGSHPVGAVLHLKHWEGLRRRGPPCGSAQSAPRSPASRGFRRSPGSDGTCRPSPRTSRTGRSPCSPSRTGPWPRSTRTTSRWAESATW